MGQELLGRGNIRIFLLGFILFTGVRLASAQPGQMHNVKINLNGIQGACQLRYHLVPTGNWVALPEARQGSNSVDLPSVEVELEASQPNGLVLYWTKQMVRGLDSYVEMHLDRFPNWPPLLGGLALIVAGCFGLYRRRYRKSLLHLAEQEPLIRSDGKVPSRKVGTYQLTQLLGKGGMGVVYKAISEDGIPVAIKVPAPHLISQADFRQRFFREIELGLKLRHPRVVQVLELPPEEELYVVMEYVEGMPMSDMPVQPWAAEQRITLGWAEQALEALEFIHAQGVIHRDLKPSNLMILPNKSLKLMDFGIAHKVHGTRLTGTGNILGTPIYMAPEQLQGLDIDPRADLYSLGVILYERLLPGLPFPVDVMELLRYKLTHSLQSLSSQGVQLAPGVDEFVNRLVAQNPDDRYQSASEALLALRPLLKGFHSRAPRPQNA